jgi:hypothetical protein
MRNYASPVFQHRHYALIAKVLADNSSVANRDVMIDKLAALFANDNPAFDRQRFRDAAHGEPNGKDKR